MFKIGLKVHAQYLNYKAALNKNNNPTCPVKLSLRKYGMRQHKKQAYVFIKIRKAIEMLFSQLCDQFMIMRRYAGIVCKKF